MTGRGRSGGGFAFLCGDGGGGPDALRGGGSPSTLGLRSVAMPRPAELDLRLSAEMRGGGAGT